MGLPDFADAAGPSLIRVLCLVCQPYAVHMRHCTTLPNGHVPSWSFAADVVAISTQRQPQGNAQAGHSLQTLTLHN